MSKVEDKEALVWVMVGGWAGYKPLSKPKDPVHWRICASPGPSELFIIYELHNIFLG